MSWFHLHPWMTFILAVISICAVDNMVGNVARAVRRLPLPEEQKELPPAKDEEGAS